MSIPAAYISPENNLFQFLDTVGDESGTIDALGDYSSDTDIFIQPPANKVYELHRLMVFIQSTGVIASGKYGDQTLSVGIKAIVKYGANQTEKLLNKVLVLSHDDWAGICHDSKALDYGNIAGKSVAVRWSFFKSGDSIWLNGNTEDKFIIRLKDDFSDLIHHRFHMQGKVHNV